MAVVAALRTPFCRVGTSLAGQDCIELGAMVVEELLERTQIRARDVSQIVFGNALMLPEVPSVAREIAVACGLDQVDAYSVTRAGATSFQTVASAAESLLSGSAEIVIAGGTDSTSMQRATLTPRFSAVLRDVRRAKRPGARLKTLAQLRPKDLVPVAPGIREYSVGEAIGEACERMVRKWGVTRAEQDDFAHASHVKAAKAWDHGLLEGQVIAAHVRDDKGPCTVDKDNLVRWDSDRAHYDRLKPTFDAREGSITPGNSSPPTDGAAGMILMSEARARALGLDPLGYIRSYAFAAKTPREDMLMGPVFAAPIALDRAGIGLRDLTLVDLHEAFAGQVACNLRGLASAEYMRELVGRRTPVGEVDPATLNVNGGSIAYGHPFGATGARLIGQTLHELKRRGGGLALATACAAGGIGAAMVVERP